MPFFGGGGASVDLASPPAIGNTTPNTGAFTTLSATPPANTTAFNSTGYSLTGTNAQTLLNLAGTWNTTGTPTGILLNITNTASNTASRLIDLKIGGTTKFAVEALTGSAFTITQYGFTLAGRTDFQDAVGLTSNGEYRIGGDVALARDAANVFAQRRTTNAQTFRIYNTFTDASNYERGFLSWTSNTFRIGTEKAGTGSQRNLEIYTDGTLRMYVTNNAVRLTNNAYLTLGTGGLLPEGGGASNYLLFRNNSGTELGRFQGNGIFSFTGTTSSFPALKPSSAVLQVRLADDSGYTVLDAQLRAQGTAPATAGATGTAGDIRYDADYIYICTATNTWKRVAIATWP